MLGTVDRTQVAAMLEALADGDGLRLLQVVAALAEFSPDWSGVLEALAEALHRIQVQQLVPGAQADGEGIDAAAFAQRLRPEVVQLWYQMALSGRRDLHLAPSPRAGFEMAVLRMLAFRPAAAVPPVPRDPGTGTEVGSGSHGAEQGGNGRRAGRRGHARSGCARCRACGRFGAGGPGGAEAHACADGRTRRRRRSAAVAPGRQRRP